MKAGQIVRVDFRNPLPGSNELNKVRPAVIVGAPPIFGAELKFELVVPLSSAKAVALTEGALLISPTAANGANAASFAIAWNVQAVPHARIRETRSHVSAAQLAEIRRLIAACIGINVGRDDAQIE